MWPGARREREDAAISSAGGLVAPAEIGAQPDHAQQRVRDRVDRDDERPEQPREREERRRGAQRDALGAPQRPHLRRLLAERHVERGDDREREADRDHRAARTRSDPPATPSRVERCEQ
jgi:hypothetical protein